MVACACNPSYSGGSQKGLEFELSSGGKVSKAVLKNKRVRAWPKCQSICLAYAIPGVQPPTMQKKILLIFNMKTIGKFIM
jgi:hypothetical protein